MPHDVEQHIELWFGAHALGELAKQFIRPAFNVDLEALTRRHQVLFDSQVHAQLVTAGVSESELLAGNELHLMEHVRGCVLGESLNGNVQVRAVDPANGLNTVAEVSQSLGVDGRLSRGRFRRKRQEPEFSLGLRNLHSIERQRYLCPAWARRRKFSYVGTHLVHVPRDQARPMYKWHDTALTKPGHKLKDTLDPRSSILTGSWHLGAVGSGQNRCRGRGLEMNAQSGESCQGDGVEAAEEVWP